MSPWVAFVVVVVFGTTAFLDIYLRGSEVQTTTTPSIEEIIKADKANQADRVAQVALCRINQMWKLPCEE